MVDQVEVEIMGRVVLLVGMVALVEAEIMGRVVLLLVGMVALVEAEITGEAALLLVGMAALVEAEITGRAVIPLAGVVVLLVETTEVAEEGLRQRETLRMLQSLDGQTLQQGRSEWHLVQPKDEVLTATMVRLIRTVIVSFRLPPYAVHLFQSGLWDAFSSPPPEVIPEPGPTPAQRYPPSSNAPQMARQPVAVAGPSTSAPQIDCFCGKPSVERTVRKESENKGRIFRRCGQAQDCNFFEWVDELPQEGNAKLSRPPNPSIPTKRSRTDDAVRVSYDQFYAQHEL